MNTFSKHVGNVGGGGAPNPLDFIHRREVSPEKKPNPDSNNGGVSVLSIAKTIDTIGIDLLNNLTKVLAGKSTAKEISLVISEVMKKIPKSEFEQRLMS
jgi:hypothetical protein